MHKIKLVHILTETDTPREIASVDSVSPVSNYGVEYIQQINVRYKGDDWKITPAVSQSEFTNHGPGHYGAFQSFKKAILENFTSDIDSLVLCECDCIIETPTDFFVEKLNRGVSFCQDYGIEYLSLGSRFVNGFLQSPELEEAPNYPDFYVTNKIILAHCVVLPQSSRQFIMEALEKYSWDSPDIWFNEVFWREGRSRFGIIKERLAHQHEGISLIDNVWKESQ
jgi:hypothetical protein